VEDHPDSDHNSKYSQISQVLHGFSNAGESLIPRLDKCSPLVKTSMNGARDFLPLGLEMR
jgi:hypothetical protein